MRSRENCAALGQRGVLEAAFAATIYRVDVPGARFDLRIGQNDPGFDIFLRAHHARYWGIVTAFNPGAIPCSDEENTERQKQLREMLEQRNWRFFPACNLATEGTWPPEPAYLVLQIDRQQLSALAGQFSQSAVVYGELSRPPRLLWI